VSDAGAYLEHMTWAEAEAARARYPVLLLPLGARLKEHGLHLPLKNDWLLAERLAARVVARAPVLALPTLQHGYYPAFVDYPGSVTLRRETATALVVDVLASLGRHGWSRAYVLNTGLSTCRALEPAREALAGEGLLMDYLDLAGALAPLEADLAEQVRGSHADEVETSLMLHLAPEVVRLERARRDDAPRRGPGPFRRDPDAAGGILSPTGAWGDPTLATAAKGARFAAAVVARALADVEALAAAGYAPPPPRERFLA